MGRQSKPPVRISTLLSEEISLSSVDQLPPFRKFIDIANGRAGRREHVTRFYFQTPSLDEALAAKKIVSQIMGGNAGAAGHRAIAIGDYATQKISSEFGIQLSCLIINSFQGKHLSATSLSCISVALRRFIEYLATTLGDRLSSFTIYSFAFDDWLSFKGFIEQADVVDKKRAFFDVLGIFAAYPATSFGGSLRSISPPKSRKGRGPMIDGNSSFEMQGDGYSNAVMYQLLAQLLHRFKRQIGYLKYYEQLTVESLGVDWISPDQKDDQVKIPGRYVRQKTHAVVDDWLSTEDGYRKILDHKLLWFKIGAHSQTSFATKLVGYAASDPKMKTKLEAYVEWEMKIHDLPVLAGRTNIFGLYVKRTVEADITGSKNQLGFCLANIVMIYTGLNKEVVLSWPSMKNGKSILDCSDTLFVKNGHVPVEVEITGIKGRTGVLTKDKPIRTSIVVGSPLHILLREYEDHVKTDSDGPFFELGLTTIRSWGKNLDTRYVVYDDDGMLLRGLSTKRFRRVFATGKLMDHMKGVSNAQELAERLRLELDHENFDVTLSHYLFKSSSAVSILDMAIAAITSDKIQKALEFEGAIDLSNGMPFSKSVYLCECANPKNPTHGFPIAKECKYYDLCLGCKRSIVCAKHLPYICLRILQYEHQRDEMGSEWNAVYEDRWMIAMDALKRYQDAEVANGSALVERAWIQARSGNVSLPPIFANQI